MENIEHRGVWWVPSQNERIVGTLRLSRDKGLVLEGLGSGSVSDEPPLDIPVMWGTTGAGTPITLQQCRGCIAWTNRGVTNFTCTVEVAYIGAHIPEPGTARFGRAHLSLTRLMDWASIPYFTHSFADPHPDERPSITVHFDWPERISASTKDAQLSIEHRVAQKGGRAEPLVFSPGIYFDIELREPIPFTEYLPKYVRPLQNLLTLATTRPNGISQFSLYLDEPTSTTVAEVGGGQVVHALFYSSHGELSPEERLWRMDMLFTLPDVAQEWSGMLERWLSLADSLGFAFDAFFAVDYSETMYLEHRFLTVVQAAESFHRRRYKGKRVPTAEHRRRVQEILDAAPEQYQSWLRGILQHSNEPSLLLRLQDLVARTRPVLDPIVNAVSLPQRLRDIRNQLTHQTANHKERRDESLEIMRLTYVVSVMVRTCMLMEVGIPAERCRDLFRNNRRYRAEAERFPEGASIG